ncbi:MAG: hypothetical protein F8N37_03740 [Telmatospirillum sp.]|nr:hypothetical protein [Telmatospirillum sp.]
MPRPADGSSLTIEEVAPQKFSLRVTVDNESFDCGFYISRAAADQAGRLFLARKAAERDGRRKRPRRKI